MKTEFVLKAAIICIDTHGGVSFFFPLSNQRSLCSRLCACSFASGSCVSYAGTSGVGHCDLIAQRVSDHVVKNIFLYVVSSALFHKTKYLYCVLLKEKQA